MTADEIKMGLQTAANISPEASYCIGTLMSQVIMARNHLVIPGCWEKHFVIEQLERSITKYMPEYPMRSEMTP